MPNIPKGLACLTKGQLIAEATELGADTTPHMTKPSLKLAIRQAGLQQHAPESWLKKSWMSRKKVRSLGAAPSSTPG